MKEQKLQLRFVRDAALPVLLSEVTLFKCKVLLIAGLYFGTRLQKIGFRYLTKTGISVPYKKQVFDSLQKNSISIPYKNRIFSTL
jgi:hypothetical protein